MNYYMLPSLKFTLIAWLTFIGLGSLSLALKARKSPHSIHSKAAVIAKTASRLTGGVSSMTKIHLPETRK